MRPIGDTNSKSSKLSLNTERKLQTMDENIRDLSVENQEVADLEDDEEESVNSQEVANLEDTDEGETGIEEEQAHGVASMQSEEANRAFAEMRRRNKQLEAENQQMITALSKFFDADSAEDLSILANAYADEVDPEEYRQQYEHDLEFNRLKSENEELQNALLDREVDRLMAEGLREVQAIDPNVKSLEELGGTFNKCISAGLSAKEAYYAAKAVELKEKVYAPDAIGKVSANQGERDYYTSAELDNLSDEEMDANWDKVMRSMQRLK